MYDAKRWRWTANISPRRKHRNIWSSGRGLYYEKKKVRPDLHFIRCDTNLRNIIFLVHHSKLYNLFQLVLYTFFTHEQLKVKYTHERIETVLFFLDKVELALYRELPFLFISCHSRGSFMLVFYYCCPIRRRRWSLFV